MILNKTPSVTIEGQIKSPYYHNLTPLNFHCPVEECNRILSNEKTCPQHGAFFTPAVTMKMRMVVQLETDSESEYTVFPSEIVEELTKFTVREAKKEFDRIGSDELVDKIVELFPTYLKCQAGEVLVEDYANYHQKGVDEETLDILSEIKSVYLVDQVIETRHGSL